MAAHVRVLVGVLALVITAFGAGVFVSAQWGEQVPLPKPILLSGSDVGFQVEARRGATAIGRLMVRIDGAWVDADFRVGPSRVSQ